MHIVAKKPKYRHEVKFFMNEGDYYLLRNQLKHFMKQDQFASEDGTYKIRSLYFDNVYDQAVVEKLSGVLRREKFRLRYYNDDDSFLAISHYSARGKKISLSIWGGNS